MSDKIKPVVMDSRKFLGSINDSVQAKVTFIEGKIAQMGKQAGKNWKLAALRAANLFIEDVTDGKFYVADYRREKGGKFVVENVKPVQIVESQKSKLFQESCYDLVNAVEANDQKGMASAFSRMAAQRFSSRAIPYSGKVRTRDGVIRTVNVQTDQGIDEHTRGRLVAAVVESLKDQVTIKDGLVVEGRFSDGKPFKLPVTKWSKHKATARHMREAAQNAYWSKGFQARVYQVASLLHEDKVDDAVKAVAPFLKEYEEFTLLTRGQVKSLVENALAANGIFNQQLCDNVALLVYRTNLKVNKDTMLKEWRRIAKAAQHPALLENVNILGRTKNFEAAVDKFLTVVFEAMSNRDVTAEALATTLQVLKDRTPKIKESHDLSSKLDDLIHRLRGKEFDDNSIYEAEDFIATVQEELTMGEDLQNFDEMPGDEELPAEPDADAGALGDALGAEADAGSKNPSVVFNAPLINIGTEMAEKLGLGGDDEGDDLGGEDDLGGDMSGLGAGAGDQAGGEQDDLLGGGAAAAGAGGAGGAFGMESKRKGAAIKEEWDVEKYGKKPWEKGSKDDESDDSDSDSDDDDGDDDHYSFDESVTVDFSVGADYGAPALSEADAVRVANVMAKLAERSGLTGAALSENVGDLALAGFEATGMRIPQRKQNAAVDQVVALFSETVGTDAIGSGAPTALGDEDEEDVLGVDDPAEDQYKFGTTRRKGGLKRSSIGKRENKTQSESKVTWHQAQDDAVLGEMAGVKFVFDHGGNDPKLTPVILSEDGTAEIPVPANLYNSAFAAANMKQGDPAPFLAWLGEGIEQLRPESDEEAGAIDSGFEDDGQDDMDGQDEFGGEPAPGIEDAPADDMQPVDSELGGDEFGGEDDLGADEFGPDLGGEELGGELVGDEEAAGGSTVTITTQPTGEVKIDVKSNSVDMGGGLGDELGGDLGAGDEFGAEPGVEDEFGDEEMQPVDSVAPQAPPAPAGEPGIEDDGADDEFGGEEEDQFPDFAEDENITSPKSSKYSKEVKGDLRAEPEIDQPGGAGNELKGFGKTAKDGTKSGAGSPAKKPSDD